ncbi:MAG: DUF4388 domain-containing protein [Anaerolineae bacterium]
MASSLTRVDLLLLGMLLDRPMHGYELLQTLRAEGVEEWFPVSIAGLYYSLGKLRDRGFVTETPQRSATGGVKTIYRLTEEGRAAFFQGMEDLLSAEEKVHFDYNVGIYFLNRLQVEQALSLLERRRAFLTAWSQDLCRTLANTSKTLSPLQRAILDHSLRFLSMELQWLEDVIQGVRGGEYPSPGTPAALRPGLMVLSGDLSQFHLPDLIRLIAAGRHTGRLTITDGTETRSIGFAEGKPRCVWGERRGRPFLSREEALEALCDLFRWGEGTFQLDQSTACSEQCTPLDLSAENLILMGCRWVDNWSTIQRLVPSGEAVFEARLPPEEWDRFALTPGERQLLAMLDGERNVEALASDLGWTLFETSKALYGLTAAGLASAADVDRLRLRRAFREIAELLCRSTFAWRTSPDDRSCEEEVNLCMTGTPLRLRDGHLEDETPPATPTEELERLYRDFVRSQLRVISRRFGRENALKSYQQVLDRLSPDLRAVAARHGLDSLAIP